MANLKGMVAMLFYRSLRFVLYAISKNKACLIIMCCCCCCCCCFSYSGIWSMIAIGVFTYGKTEGECHLHDVYEHSCHCSLRLPTTVSYFSL